MSFMSFIYIHMFVYHHCDGDKHDDDDDDDGPVVLEPRILAVGFIQEVREGFHDLIQWSRAQLWGVKKD